MVSGFQMVVNGDGSARSSRYPVQLRDDVNYWCEFQWWVVGGGRFRREYVTDHGQIYPRWKPLPIALTRRGFTSADSTSKSRPVHGILFYLRNIFLPAVRTKRDEKRERRNKKREKCARGRETRNKREMKRGEMKRANERENDR